jgi:hypothetical protein
MLLLTWGYVLIQHQLSTAATPSGLVGIFFHFAQTALLLLGHAGHASFGWVAFFGFAPHNAFGTACVAPLSP